MIQPGTMQDAQTVQRRREVVGLSQQVPQEFPVYAAGEGEVLELAGPADVDAESQSFI